MKKIRLLSWNVNGLRAVLKKDFLVWFQKESPDLLCLQETKARQEQLPAVITHPESYQAFFSSAQRPGYSGVATLTRQKPLKVQTGFGVERFDREGRILLTEFEEFVLFNIYFPNGKKDQQRLRYKMDFYEEALEVFCRYQKAKRPVVVCGDVNTAHQPIDLAHPKENEDVSGFLPMERQWMDRFLAAGFVDAFRALNPEPRCYTWWDLRTGARARNIGWRLDYFFVSRDLAPHIDQAFHLTQVMGSDHCPVGLTLKF